MKESPLGYCVLSVCQVLLGELIPNLTPDFAGVALTDLEEQVTDGVRYYLPTLEQYLAIYQASSKDSYRTENNNQKDFVKIAYLQQFLGN